MSHTYIKVQPRLTSNSRSLCLNLSVCTTGLCHENSINSKTVSFLMGTLLEKISFADIHIERAVWWFLAGFTSLYSFWRQILNHDPSYIIATGPLSLWGPHSTTCSVEGVCFSHSLQVDSRKLFWFGSDVFGVSCTCIAADCVRLCAFTHCVPAVPPLRFYLTVFQELVNFMSFSENTILALLALYF